MATMLLRRAARPASLRQSRLLARVARLSTSHTTSAAELGLGKLGINNDKATIYRNLSYEDLNKHERENNEGVVTANGTFAVDTGKFTGRSPKDKWIVKQAPSQDKIWWGEINQPMDGAVFDELYEKVTKYYSDREKMYVFDGFCGANPASRKKVRFITELAWQTHFVTNMFLRPKSKDEIANFAPDFTIINACKVVDDDYKRHNTNSEVFVAFNIEKNVAVIGGTWYGGEMKKGIFSMMNYWLPNEGIMAMHCSANKGKNGDTALFFGLSGTGKTTLSADPHRFLIGDDEHGWDDDGIFNFEGGCYAKTINLTEETEPEIFRAIKPNALLENVVLKGDDNTPDYFDVSKTQNSRVSYPIEHIDNFEPTSMGGHPENIIFLTCDAYGVLPPVSKLTPGQAMYHFLSGYTAKVAGTERGITEPTATFSACFGAAFLPLHPTVYADLLQKKIEKHGSHVYLVNTGWTGGAHGVGKRMSIKDTRACIDAILDGSIQNSDFAVDPKFGLNIPKTLGSIDPKVLNPRDAWADKESYDKTADKLATMFVGNFKKYISPDHTDFSPYGPPQN
eukprot:CAMPEP_0202070154 /NCGR_PEP_ID=MMETSP0964-20121228/980_1 /ASSEMBLY_ACC=CAM_ASM_000500 /TAXON_ID=4773 /ORGANISM="Schizochytrium aggregatum, Strain ATCC28209" /LENGTH=564 /DNA_ID=CAMNT_0048636999 /DNA_START=35 /DNA_END=1729 /DNA_ORIENTATION=-